MRQRHVMACQARLAEPGRHAGCFPQRTAFRHLGSNNAARQACLQGSARLSQHDDALLLQPLDDHVAHCSQECIEGNDPRAGRHGWQATES